METLSDAQLESHLRDIASCGVKTVSAQSIAEALYVSREFAAKILISYSNRTANVQIRLVAFCPNIECDTVADARDLLFEKPEGYDWQCRFCGEAFRIERRNTYMEFRISDSFGGQGQGASMTPLCPSTKDSCDLMSDFGHSIDNELSQLREKWIAEKTSTASRQSDSRQAADSVLTPPISHTENTARPVEESKFYAFISKHPLIVTSIIAFLGILVSSLTGILTTVIKEFKPQIEGLLRSDTSVGSPKITASPTPYFTSSPTPEASPAASSVPVPTHLP